MAETKSTKSGFTADERDAMKQRAAELKAQAKATDLRVSGTKDVLDAIAKLDGTDKKIAARLHEIVTAAAPQLVPKTYYGMPGWANADSKIVCFFQPASKFKVRYGTLGFETVSKLDDGTMWPTAFAILELTPAHEKAITALVKKAVG
ncbi:MAG: hypothetical protein ABIR17_06475 [Pseudolysinimonas sp.]|uniref:iron chaperone n=1 Tax=Pseudolysinimonas sp. TaxID=2680009 RepID=UPI0032631FF1